MLTVEFQGFTYCLTAGGRKRRAYVVNILEEPVDHGNRSHRNARSLDCRLTANTSWVTHDMRESSVRHIHGVSSSGLRRDTLPCGSDGRLQVHGISDSGRARDRPTPPRCRAIAGAPRPARCPCSAPSARSARSRGVGEVAPIVADRGRRSCGAAVVPGQCAAESVHARAPPCTMPAIPGDAPRAATAGGLGERSLIRCGLVRLARPTTGPPGRRPLMCGAAPADKPGEPEKE